MAAILKPVTEATLWVESTRYDSKLRVCKTFFFIDLASELHLLKPVISTTGDAKGYLLPDVLLITVINELNWVSVPLIEKDVNSCSQRVTDKTG